jgi:hypothetical protein
MHDVDDQEIVLGFTVSLEKLRMLVVDLCQFRVALSYVVLADYHLKRHVKEGSHGRYVLFGSHPDDRLLKNKLTRESTYVLLAKRNWIVRAWRQNSVLLAPSFKVHMSCFCLELGGSFLVHLEMKLGVWVVSEVTTVASPEKVEVE